MPKATMKEVAAAAGVGVMTVSYAFNQPDRVAEATRLRVYEAAKALGYAGPSGTARALRSGKTGQIGVVMGEYLSYAFDDPQAAQFLAGVAEVCVENGLGMVLIPTRGDDVDIDRVLSAAVDGYVLWTTTEDDPVLSAVARSGRPASIQGGPRAEGITLVAPDDRAAAKAVASSVLEDGQAVLVLSFPFDRDRKPFLGLGREIPEKIPFPVTRHRLDGYRDALVAKGFDWNTVLVGAVSRNVRSEACSLARDALPHLEGRSLIVLAMSDELAMGAYDALQDMRDTSVLTGWDATPLAKEFGIRSVTNPLRDQGRLCAAAALRNAGDDRPIAWSLV